MHAVQRTLCTTGISLLLATTSGHSQAQDLDNANQSIASISNIVHLQASGSVEVPPDWLSFVLTSTVQDKNPQALQRQLKTALDSALLEARKAEHPGDLELRTGAFNLNPVYAKDGSISNWQGVAELILQGRNFEKITSTAGTIHSMTVARTSLGLSKELQESAEATALDQAVTQFRAKALQLAHGFGFSAYTLRDVSINGRAVQNDPAPGMLRMAAMASPAPDTPVSVEAGKSLVRITLTGTVQLK